ncbi:phospholipase D [Streptomyces sp. NRRL F-5755]|uniref:phospholipase n=1 Tax=Streptomyces sp. NRRL F-5755 TaxID=1519475 RepID=UPI0006BF6200|nr:phospholipase [Streptomyces sp. NRRL F-5755]KOU05882.1 phospholipase D [Streptomyces sp. NRRL F-5755]
MAQSPPARIRTRVPLLATTGVLALLCASTPAAAATGPQRPAPRPTYAIAHRVLTADGVDTALRHGANAVEIDATAWKKGWWADHDGTLTSAGDPMETMLKRIAQRRAEGRNVTFVWLDIKNPDHCRSDDAKRRHCSVAALRDMARRTVEKQGVRVLYGFYGTEGGTGWKDVTSRLRPLEGVGLSGNAEDVAKSFAAHGSRIPARQRVMDKGLFSLSLNARAITSELRAGSKARDRGALASTAGWTVGTGDAKNAAGLLAPYASGGAGADGLIYGKRAACYPDGTSTWRGGCGTDESSVKRALSSVTGYVAAHPAERRMATTRDIPFGS